MHYAPSWRYFSDSTRMEPIVHGTSESFLHCWGLLDYLFTWVIMIKVICIWLANNSNSLCQCITLLCHLKALQSEPPECYRQPPSGFAEHTITASLVCYILVKSNVGPCYWSVWATDYGNSTCCIGAIRHNILDIKEAQHLNRKGQRWFAGSLTCNSSQSGLDTGSEAGEPTWVCATNPSCEAARNRKFPSESHAVQSRVTQMIAIQCHWWLTLHLVKFSSRLHFTVKEITYAPSNYYWL